MNAKDKTTQIEETPLEERVSFLMFQSYGIWLMALKKVLDNRFELSHTQFVILRYAHHLIYTKHRNATQSVLSRNTRVEPMTVSQTLKVLEKKGYIYRQAHPEDVRSKIVLLTDTGKALIEEAIAAIDILADRFYNPNHTDIPELKKCLESLIQANALTFANY